MVFGEQTVRRFDFQKAGPSGGPCNGHALSVSNPLAIVFAHVAFRTFVLNGSALNINTGV